MQKDDVYVISDEDLQLPRRSNPLKKKRPFGRRSTPRPGGSRPAIQAGQPRVAASLSLWLSGTGQFLHGQWKIGSFYLVALGFVASFHYFLYMSWQEFVAFANSFNLEESALLVGVMALDFFFTIVLLSGVHNAYWIGTLILGSSEASPPHPLVAGAASLVIPGWGQIVNGQIRKAMVFLFVFFSEVMALVLSLILSEPIGRLLMNGWETRRLVIVGAPLLVCGVLCWCLSLYDAVLVATYRRGRLP